MPGMQVKREREHQESAGCYWIFAEGLQPGLNPTGVGFRRFIKSTVTNCSWKSGYTEQVHARARNLPGQKGKG